MEWLFIIGLTVWVIVLQLRLNSAERGLGRLSQKLIPAATPEPPVDEPSLPFMGRVETKSGVGLPDAEPRPQAPPVPLRGPPSQPGEPPGGGRPVQPRPAPAISTWLSENGLAWIGGGALALGGTLLAGYAAQRGLFTPALRIWAALLAGLLMLGAGEWIRRRDGRQSLAAAMATGAGATTLYAAIWAAYGLYHFLGVVAAGTGLTLVSAALLALAFLHGEALALLAILAAFAVPAVCGKPAWPGAAIDGYAALIIATGLGAAALRGWARAGVLTLIGAGIWSIARSVAADSLGAAALDVATPALALLAASWRGAGVAEERWRAVTTGLPPPALIGASVLALLVWGAPPGGQTVAFAMAVIALAALSGLAVGVGLARPGVLAAPAAALCLALVSALVAPAHAIDLGQGLWLLAAVASVATVGLALTLTHAQRVEAAVVGAAGTAAALTLLDRSLGRLPLGAHGLILAVAAALLCGGALLVARRSARRTEDLAQGAWIAASAEAVGLTLHALVPAEAQSAAYATLAMVLALGSWRLGWRGFAQSSAIAALASFAFMLAPAVAGEALLGHLAWTTLALIGAAAAGLQALSWQVLKRRGDSTASAEAVSTTALLTGLATAFLLFRQWATGLGHEAAALDSLTEAALRTQLLLAAGLVLSIRGGASRLARVRGPIFLAAGAVHGFLIGVVALNPWFQTASLVAGPPVLDSLALAYLAPALLLGAAAWRAADRRFARVVAIPAVFFAVMWAMSEIRRLFHGPAMASASASHAELAAYGVAILAFALGLRRPRVRAAALGWIGSTPEWIALVVSLVLLADLASPWWGPLTGVLGRPLLFFALLAAGTTFTALIARPGRGAAPGPLAHTALVATVIEIFALLTLLIRFAYHGAAMRTPLREASVETWTFSAAWALLGVLVLVAGVRGRDRALRWLGLIVLLITTAKVFLFDMATLEGVIRAASFLALGALLLIAALAARRFGGRAEPAADPVAGAPP